MLKVRPKFMDAINNDESFTDTSLGAYDYKGSAMGRGYNNKYNASNNYLEALQSGQRTIADLRANSLTDLRNHINQMDFPDNRVKQMMLKQDKASIISLIRNNGYEASHHIGKNHKYEDFYNPDSITNITHDKMNEFVNRNDDPDNIAWIKHLEQAFDYDHEERDRRIKQFKKDFNLK